MKITNQFLKKIKACQDQIELFEEIFPSGCCIDKNSVVKAAEQGLYISWFANHVLFGSFLSKFQIKNNLIWAEHWNEIKFLWSSNWRTEYAPDVEIENLWNKHQLKIKSFTTSYQIRSALLFEEIYSTINDKYYEYLLESCEDSY
jgi:plasmid rolling circle replication initiator protein Rep